jgi:hypothetical protein
MLAKTLHNPPSRCSASIARIRFFDKNTSVTCGYQVAMMLNLMMGTHG